ncbi:MMPL family transporter [Psychrobacillus lasiicapitis]|uniref:MMPL family transporter n=1 Tax=Psychrobacillus lasiicapitis TaxID=1636719 RepID=A0A544SYK5_9BACI|nr:MMPL family transporter [Psychrobacillus lasiicapitis]TQR10285.1 MMPL family transporter [Psychrobacillus lasiicapitis]GGA46974.1 membrane protein [Psychrobacillus lasiicapitis]
MKSIIKGRWAIFAIWLIATILLTVIQPDINAILRQQGQEGTSSESPSVIAGDILDKMNTTEGTDNLIVFYDKDKISDEDMKQIGESVESIRDSSAELGVNEMIDPFSMPDAKSALVSEDGTTLMVSYKLDKKGREIDDIKEQFESKLEGVPVDYYLSGEDFINNDYLKASQAGVEKSAALTVIFILVVLIIAFRSVVTPFISLIAVAFSYLVSMGIAAQLIDKAGFPITSLTQMLLVLILFGIGTDYNILLFNRFKEELAHGHSVDDSIINTYKTAGKTIAYSILTVFIAFLALVFSESPIYKSGVVVVIGVTILLLQILTLTPFIMKVLGKKIFWPSKNAGGHKENKFWEKTSSFGIKHPILITVIILLIIGPMIFFHEEKLNFDTVGELGDSYPSSKAINLVAEHFGKGQAMPATVVIESDEPMDQNETLAVVDNITERLKALKGVKMVSSVTQPQGEQIADFYVDSQMGSVTEGISETQNGVDQIYNGLAEAQKGLESADFSEVNKMVDGTTKLQDGMTALTSGLKQIQAGIDDGTSNPQTIYNGLSTIETNLSAMSSGVSVLADSYEKMQAGYAEMGTHYQDAAKALLGVKDALTQMKSMTDALGSSYAESSSDANFQALKQTIDQLSTSLNQITPESMAALNENYNTVTAGFTTANKNLANMSKGLTQMADGLKKLKNGLGQASSGINTIVTNMNAVNTGLGQMKAGQQQLVEGLNGFGEFGKKLTDVNDGLQGISDGLGQTNGYLTQLNTNKTFFIPEEALTNEEFKKSLDAFMSEDRKITKMTIVLKDDPYSDKALATINQINDTLSEGLKGTVLSDAKSGTVGTSATTNDMNDVLSRDLSRTTVIVIIGVLLVLFLVIRSFWTPVFITASLVGAYYTAMFLINFIFLNLLGYAGISSFVPFFSFIIIVALGVDYSIFLMMRFKEYPDLSPKEAIVLASKHTGGVIISAVIILGGTFATLIPAGIILLTELAIAVITGLIVLCFVLLPLFVPALMALPDAVANLFSKEKKRI